METKTWKRLTVLLTTVLIMLIIMPWLTDQSKAYADGKTDYERVMSVEEPDTYKDESFEPYGYGQDVPFFMNKQSELLFYQTSPDSSGEINTFFDKLKSESDGDVLNGTKTSALKAPPNDLKKAYFVKSVSFDPTGTGRDDHIAFIGVYWDGSHAKARVWAYNTRSRAWSSAFDLGSGSGLNCDWMEEDHITEFEAMGFLSITAGDYNGDGKDTLVAYAAFTGEDGFSNYELECNNLTIKYYGNKYKGSDLCHDWYGGWVSKKDTPATKMSSELDTGDVNGDGLDDLVALTYIGNWKDTSQPSVFYRPVIAISYGKAGGSGFTKKCDKWFGTWDWIEGWKFDNMVSPGMSLGDVNKDGKDEIVVAGIKCLTKMKDEDTTEICNEIDSNENTLVVIADEEGEFLYSGTQTSNAWMKKGFYDEKTVWNKSAVECVAVNGPGNPEMIFINGTLYKFDDSNGTGRLNAAHTPDYFQNSGDNLTSKISTNMFIQSTAAGNFDANTKGYEQVAFTVSCKTESKRSYDYLRGVIGGKNYNGTTGQARAYYSTSMGNMNDDHAWPGRGKDNASGYISERQGLNCLVVGADNDNDGVLAKYKEKALLFSDPEVLCVLQAPPFFKEVQDYMTDTSETAYEVSDTYSYDKTTSDSVSFGVGVVAGMESPAMQMELSAGYALDWTKEFTEGIANTETLGWKAKEEDLVLVQRKPVVSYYYEIQGKDGNWSGDHMVVTVPCKPDLVTMGIQQYNAFATYYNKTLTSSQYLSDYHKKNVPDYMKQYHTLDLLNNQWLGHEGEPDKYIKWTNKKFRTDNRFKILQSQPMRLGHNSESVSWGKTDSSSVGVTESMSHGFTYDATIAMGPNVGAASLYVGLTTSLQYMTGESTTTTQTTEKGISCDVNGLKVKDMPDSLRGNDYNFSFKMARWPSGIKHYVNGVAEDVPVYGYALSSVTKPSANEAITVADQLAACAVEEQIANLPAMGELSTEDEGAVNTIRDDYDKLSDPAKTLIDENEIAALESRIALLKNNGLDLSTAKVVLKNASYTYNGKVQVPVIKTVGGYILQEGLDYTAKWSNKSSKNAGVYKVTLTGTGICSGSVTASYKINKAANPLKVGAKTASIKYKVLKKKSQSLKAAKVIKFTKAGQGAVSYVKSKGNKKISINKKTGKVTIKKGLKKGTYKVTVKVQAAGNGNYNKSAVKKITFKIKVK